jgi:ribosomal-protein-alanine N-acetyltransferase
VTGYGIGVLGLVRIEARVFEWNAASFRVLDRAGYALEGRARRAVVKDARIIDVLQYAFVVPGP